MLDGLEGPLQAITFIAANGNEADGAVVARVQVFHAAVSSTGTSEGPLIPISRWLARGTGAKKHKRMKTLLRSTIARVA